MRDSIGLNGSGAGRPKARYASVDSTATGNLIRLPHLLGSSSVISLAAGSNANYSLTGGDTLSATSALGNATQKALIKEDLGDLSMTYPLFVTGVGPVPVLIPSFSIASSGATQAEGNSGTTAFVFTVTRSTDTSGTNAVDWAVTGSGTNPASAADFSGGVLPSGTLTFAPGDTTKTITVNVVGDTTYEPDEGFTVTLANPTNGATITTGSFLGTVTNDDTAALNALTLDATTANVGTASTINILSATAGTTITGTVPDGMTLNSAARTITGTPTLYGTYTFPLTETPTSGAPRVTTVTITVGQQADTLPTLATPGATYVAWYDATSDDSAKVTLATAGIMTATAANASGRANRVSTLKNRITGAGALPDMVAIAAGSVRQNGAIFLKNVSGKISGLMFEDNERGLATAVGTGIALTTSTPYTVVDIFTLDRARSAKTTTTYSIPSFLGSNTTESGGNNNFLTVGTATAPLATGPGGPNPGCIGVNAWNNSAASGYVAKEATDRSTTAQTCCVIRRAIPSAAAGVSGQVAGTVKTFINSAGNAITCTLRDNTGTSRLAIGNNIAGAAGSFFRGIYHEQIVITGAAPTDADIATIIAWAQNRHRQRIGVARAVTGTAAIGQSNSLAKSAGFWGGSSADGSDYWIHQSALMTAQLFGDIG